MPKELAHIALLFQNCRTSVYIDAYMQHTYDTYMHTFLFESVCTCFEGVVKQTNPS
jgi:hypothetical protein